MNPLVLVFFLFLNFGISWLNAWGCGRYWTESKITKGWPRILVWSGVVMSAVGFTWVYLTLLTLGAVAFEFLTPDQGSVMFDLGFLILIPALLTSGTIIWINSLIMAWRKRSFGNIAIAGWNTYAHARNVWTVARHAPGALENVLDFFFGGSKKSTRRRSSSSKGEAGFLIVLLVILAIAGGTLTTAAIVRSADKKHALEVTSSFR